MNPARIIAIAQKFRGMIQPDGTAFHDEIMEALGEREGQAIMGCVTTENLRAYRDGVISSLVLHSLPIERDEDIYATLIIHAPPAEGVK